jgi:hypothetical protein
VSQVVNEDGEGTADELEWKEGWKDRPECVVSPFGRATVTEDVLLHVRELQGDVRTLVEVVVAVVGAKRPVSVRPIEQPVPCWAGGSCAWS